MTKTERELFKELCKYRSKTLDESLLNAASPQVLGYLFYNRMAGIAYGKIQENAVEGKLNREFRNSLKMAYLRNKAWNSDYLRCVHTLAEALTTPTAPKTAMLKGAVLCALYPEGYRTSNDIDLLVAPEDLEQTGALLREHGFRQGYLKNGKFIPASRREIINSRMLRGETVPYIKETGLPEMKFLEVDVNFSLDYKNGDTSAVSELLTQKDIAHIGTMQIPTLDVKDFFIHLCAHLYKEATTLPWIEMQRDMTLYKYCDIYSLLLCMTEEKCGEIFQRAGNLGVEKMCAYAVLETEALFDMGHTPAHMMAQAILECDPEFSIRVTDPGGKRWLKYCTKDTTERFFLSNRRKDLQEELNAEES